MKTILKRTIVFFLSLAMIISVACSTAVAAETLEDQNVTSHRVSYIIYKEDGTVKETGNIGPKFQVIDKKDLEFYKEAEKTDKSIKVCEVNEEDFLYLNFDTNFS